MRRILKLSILLFLAAIFFVGTQHMSQDYKCQECNIVLISLEPARADHIGAYGYERNTTPNIDRLAEKSLVFDRAFTQSPHTLPATISTFTSQYLSQHGVDTNSERGVRNQTNFVDVLNEEGYNTWAVTSGANTGYKRGLGHETFDNYRVERSPTQKASYFESRLNNIESEEKFFFFYQMYTGHDPYLAPKNFSRMFNGTDRGFRNKSKTEWIKLNRNGLNGTKYREYRDYYFSKIKDNDSLRQHAISEYDGQIRHSDVGVGLVLDELEEREEMDNTVVVVMSEHGELLGEHEEWRHYTLWNEVIRVPLILYVPDSEAKSVSNYVELIDLVPALMNIVEAESEIYRNRSSGESFLKIFEGKEWNKEFVLSENPEQEQKAFIDVNHGLKYYERLGEKKVYNLSEDFSEKNVITENKTIEYMEKQFEDKYGEIQGKPILKGGKWPYFS